MQIRPGMWRKWKKNLIVIKCGYISFSLSSILYFTNYIRQHQFFLEFLLMPFLVKNYFCQSSKYDRKEIYRLVKDYHQSKLNSWLKGQKIDSRIHRSITLSLLDIMKNIDWLMNYIIVFYFVKKTRLRFTAISELATIFVRKSSKNNLSYNWTFCIRFKWS